MTYQSLTTCQLKDIAKVEVFEKYLEHQGQGYQFRPVGTQKKALPQETVI
jgi:hypothetical protein